MYRRAFHTPTRRQRDGGKGRPPCSSYPWTRFQSPHPASSATPPLLRPTQRPLVRRVALVASVGNALQGCDNSAIAGSLLFLVPSLGLSEHPHTVGAIVSMPLLGALIATLLAGPAADGVGRRPVLVTAAALFIAGNLIQLYCGVSVALLLAARCTVGIATGLVVTLVPLLISECSPSHVRGQLAALPQLTGIMGMAVAYACLLGITLLRHQPPWHLMLSIGTAPAVVYLSLLLLTVPESPRWLAQHGRHAEAHEVLRSLHGPEADALELLGSRRSTSLQQPLLRDRGSPHSGAIGRGDLSVEVDERAMTWPREGAEGILALWVKASDNESEAASECEGGQRGEDAAGTPKVSHSPWVFSPSGPQASEVSEAIPVQAHPHRASPGDAPTPCACGVPSPSWLQPRTEESAETHGPWDGFGVPAAYSPMSSGPCEYLPLAQGDGVAGLAAVGGGAKGWLESERDANSMSKGGRDTNGWLEGGRGTNCWKEVAGDTDGWVEGAGGTNGWLHGRGDTSGWLQGGSSLGATQEGCLTLESYSEEVGLEGGEIRDSDWGGGVEAGGQGGGDGAEGTGRAGLRGFSAAWISRELVILGDQGTPGSPPSSFAASAYASAPASTAVYAPSPAPAPACPPASAPAPVCAPAPASAPASSAAPPSVSTAEVPTLPACATELACPSAHGSQPTSALVQDPSSALGPTTPPLSSSAWAPASLSATVAVGSATDSVSTSRQSSSYCPWLTPESLWPAVDSVRVCAVQGRAGEALWQEEAHTESACQEEKEGTVDTGLAAISSEASFDRRLSCRLLVRDDSPPWGNAVPSGTSQRLHWPANPSDEPPEARGSWPLRLCESLGLLGSARGAPRESQRGSQRILYERKVLKSLLVSMGLQCLQQACGLSAVLRYLPMLLVDSAQPTANPEAPSGVRMVAGGNGRWPWAGPENGWRPEAGALLAGAFIAALMTPFAALSLSLLDSRGRRWMLLATIPFVSAALLCATLSSALMRNGKWASVVTAASLAAYCCAFIMGLGPIPNIVSAEVAPREVRGKHVSLTVGLNWLCGIAISFFLPRLQADVGAAGLYGIFFFASILTWLFFYLAVPETRGVPLDEVIELFE